MHEDNQIPLTENEKGVIKRYLKEIGDIRNLLEVKSGALDDILGVMIEARGLSLPDYQVDIRSGMIVKRGGENVLEKEEAPSPG